MKPSARSAILGLAVVAVAAFSYVLVYKPWAKGRSFQPPAVSFEGDSAALRQSVVVPTLDTPMPDKMNVVWCGSMQLAWNRLGTQVLHGQPAIRGAETVVSRLNQAPFKEGDVAAESCFAAAGFIKDGIAESIRSEMQQRFQRDVELEAAPLEAVLAYAYLQSHVAFRIPFFDSVPIGSLADHSLPVGS